jgi:hypothetical protein
MSMVSKSVQGNQISALGQEVMNSPLFDRMRDAIGNLPSSEMGNEVKSRFVEIQKMVENCRANG